MNAIRVNQITENIYSFICPFNCHH